MEDIDWRIKATAKVSKDQVNPWGTDFKKDAQLKMVSVVKLPKGRTLTLPVPNVVALYINNSENCWSKSWDFRKRYNIDASLRKEVTFEKDKDAFDVLELIASSVIFAYTAIEAFCNDSIPEDHEFWHLKRSEIILEKSDKKAIERYFSLESKLNNILPELFEVQKPKGQSPVWVNYKKLKNCRDQLIHVKSSETRSADINKKNLWDLLFEIRKPHMLAKDIFDWFLKNAPGKPLWYTKYPK